MGFYGSNDPTNSVKALKEHTKLKSLNQIEKKHHDASKLRNADNTSKTQQNKN